jgi:hypothetical protein
MKLAAIPDAGIIKPDRAHQNDERDQEHCALVGEHLGVNYWPKHLPAEQTEQNELNHAAACEAHGHRTADAAEVDAEPHKNADDPDNPK